MRASKSRIESTLGWNVYCIFLTKKIRFEWEGLEIVKQMAVAILPGLVLTLRCSLFYSSPPFSVQGTCVFDAEECVKCMLKKEEACTTGSAAGSGFCEREVLSSVEAEEDEAKQMKKR